MIIRDPAGLKAAFGENPKFVYGEQKKMPMTRMGTAALLRQAFVDAQNYRDKIRNRKKRPGKTSGTGSWLETISLVLKKRYP